jgi:hypothetical protein
MTTVFLILLALVVAGAVVFFLMKTGKIEDKDGNNIPDVIEEKIEDVKEVVSEVKEIVEKVTKVKKTQPKKPTEKKVVKKPTTKKK